ncbi:hypothetical protein [Streptomyces sp. Ag109_G2-15]|uniref:hypothetical protein n=1 Tax=Streptomyces sp. Ag109_G2-15 TaxID=1938850 RepID=UPI000BDC965A|nr:hypothetical protein [Streptomyces sp. Ag109_G2-15]SOD85885.1 hypothetical protein SAMN06272765_3321 [Streptomyces sp. Ag109_G2-15]
MKKSVAATTVAAVIVAAGGVVYASGTYDTWRDGQALDHACKGLASAAEARKALGMDRVSGKAIGRPGCRVYDPGDTNTELVIMVQRGQDAASIRTNSTKILTTDREQALVPVSNGWPALVSSGTTTKPYATAYLPCGKNANDDLVLSMSVANANASANPQKRRNGMAVMVTRALKQAAKDQGCALPDTKKVTAAPSAGVFDKLKKSGAATGTCQGVNSASYEAQPDPVAPIEQCFLATSNGEPTFRIAAYYGPYTNAPRRNPFRSPDDYVGTSGSNEGKSWTTASCPTGTALYTLEPLTSHAKASASERQALITFATQSAKRHSCSSPHELVNR